MRFVRNCAVLVVCGGLLVAPLEGRAETLHTAVVEVIVGIVAGTAAITVGVVLLVKHKPSITGCAVASADGFSLKNEGNGQTYVLKGDLASLTPGRRVRLTGNKEGEGSQRDFVVKHVTQNFGPCAAAPI